MNQEAARPRGRPRDDELAARRCEEILEVATRLFAERGYRRTDVQVVADELKLGKGTIYRYFPTKRELFLAAVDRGMRRLTERADAARTQVADPLVQMQAGIRAYLTFFAENPDLVELFIQERAEFRDREKATYFVYRDRHTNRWQEVVRALTADGRIRAVPAEWITRVMGDLLYGTMFTNYFTRRSEPVEEQAASIIDITFRGILSEQERGRLHAS